jgi:hypothetical protein
VNDPEGTSKFRSGSVQRIGRGSGHSSNVELKTRAFDVGVAKSKADPRVGVAKRMKGSGVGSFPEIYFGNRSTFWRSVEPIQSAAKPNLPEETRSRSARLGFLFGVP